MHAISLPLSQPDASPPILALSSILLEQINLAGMCVVCVWSLSCLPFQPPRKPNVDSVIYEMLDMGDSTTR